MPFAEGGNIRREKIMSKNTESILGLEKLIDFIASEYKPQRIILFGSYGTEMGNKKSDIDLLIIKKTHKRFVDRAVELMQLIRSQFGFEFPVEPLIYTPDEFRKAKEINSLFTRTVLSKGVILYEKK